MVARVRSLLTRLRISPFIANIGKLAAFTILGQLLTLASAPILTRLYSPKEFGLYGLFLTFGMFASVATTLSYDSAIPGAHNDKDAVTLVRGAVLVTLAGATLLTLVYLALIVFQIFGYGVLPATSAALMWLFLGTQAAISIPQFWFIRRQMFDPVGRGILTLNAGRSAGQIGAGAIGVGWCGLAIGEIAGRVVNAGLLSRRLAADLRERAVPKASVWLVVEALHRYRSFPLVLFPAMAIDALVAASLLGGINFIYGTAAAGQVFLMRRTVDLPLGFIGKTLSDAFHGKAAEIAAKEPARLRPLMARMFWGLALVSALGLLPVMLFGPSLFSVIY